MEVSRTLVYYPVHSETHSHQREGRGLGERKVIVHIVIHTCMNDALHCITLHIELC